MLKKLKWVVTTPGIRKLTTENTDKISYVLQVLHLVIVQF